MPRQCSGFEGQKCRLATGTNGATGYGTITGSMQGIATQARVVVARLWGPRARHENTLAVVGPRLFLSLSLYHCSSTKHHTEFEQHTVAGTTVRKFIEPNWKAWFPRRATAPHAKPSLQESSRRCCRNHTWQDVASHARRLYTTQVTVTPSNLHLLLLCSRSKADRHEQA